MRESFKSNQLKPLVFPGARTEGDESGSERRDAAEHRQRILDTARALFSEYGVDRVSMHQIAQCAGVGQGTLYRRYAHKGLLCTALLNAGIIAFQRELLAYLEQAGEHVSALDRLFYVLSRLIEFNEANAPLLSAITDAACGERRNSQGPLYFWLREIVIALLQRAAERGEIDTPDIEYAADIVLLPLAIDFYLYQRQQAGFTRDRIAAGLRHFLQYGLNAR